MNRFLKWLQASLIFIFSFSFSLSLNQENGRTGESGLSIEYTVNILKEELDHFHVRAQISSLAEGCILLAMTQNYGQLKKLEEIIPEVSVKGVSQDKSHIKKISEFLWEIVDATDADVVIDYAVKTRFPYSSLNMVRLPYRDEEHLYFPASSVFIQPDRNFLAKHKIKIQSIKINFSLPINWFAVTSWGTKHTSYRIDPPCLDTLNEGLIGAGPYHVYSLKLGRFPAEIAALSSSEDQDEKINLAIEKALRSGWDLFGFVPLPKFFALIHFILDQPGQSNGSSLGWSINLNFSRRFNHFQWISMASHLFSEIFHFWNGTEGQPLSRAQDDRSTIWFTEGITDFYRLKFMAMSGFISSPEYLQLLSEDYNQVIQSSRHEDDLSRISQDYYSDPEAMALTYSKGCCLAFALDLLLQHISSGKKSFDDVMKLMLEKYDYRKDGHCYSHQELNGVFQEILGGEYFPSYKRLYGKDFVPEFKAILDKADLCLEKRKGKRLFFGVIDFGPPSGPPMAFRLDRESPSYKAGLRERDVLLEVNGCPVKELSDIQECLREKREDEAADLIVLRDGHKIKLRTLWSSFETRFEIKKSRINQD